jgi:hypothetical protein
MKEHLQTLIDLFKANNFDGLSEHYLASSEPENIAQLAFVFQQGQKSVTRFDFYQQIITKFIGSKGLPERLIKEFKTSDMLSFFTPALLAEGSFNKVNQFQRNVLHYLLVGNPSLGVDVQPPFNYLRSMMLFGSNEPLCNALCQRDSQNLTPVEAYFHYNKNLTVLPNHELSALFALIEIENKQQSVNDKNYIQVIQAVQKLCRTQVQDINESLQRLLLIASYYKKPVKEVNNEINGIK